MFLLVLVVKSRARVKEFNYTKNSCGLYIVHTDIFVYQGIIKEEQGTSVG